MAEFRNFNYSMRQVVQAGDALREELVWSEDHRDELLEIFTIANLWRESHLYPMYRMRHEMSGKMRRKKLAGIAAARLKRMPSIRKKLRRISSKLNQLQDLGGCRAILPSIADANSLLDAYRNGAKHEFMREKNYIANPKIGGYRSHHMIFRYVGNSEDEVYNGRRIELQIRTRLQHTWGTAVEAVGLLRNEDMKAGEGNPDWLKLFDLMSAELALAERCPEPPHLPSRKERVAEIIELNKKLNALSTLENFRHAVRFAMTYTHAPGDAPKCFRIEYNHAATRVTVSPHSRPVTGVEEYEKAELEDSIAGDGNIDTVFVDADKLEDLQAAYPNYFGDVQLFCRNLESITQGKTAKEYTLPPQATVPLPPKETPDLSWFRRRGRWS